MNGPSNRHELKAVNDGWVVERVRDDKEGQIEVTRFTGYDAKARAEQYLLFMQRVELFVRGD
jgi:hypothetical protein